MGDNRENSYDSRFFDEPYIPESQIISKILIDFNAVFRWVFDL